MSICIPPSYVRACLCSIDSHVKRGSIGDELIVSECQTYTSNLYTCTALKVIAQVINSISAIESKKKEEEEEENNQAAERNSGQNKVMKNGCTNERTNGTVNNNKKQK